MDGWMEGGREATDVLLFVACDVTPPMLSLPLLLQALLLPAQSYEVNSDFDGQTRNWLID
ncbi:hypothetical protein E2C01_019020 [Portunus trituberculatus]|uniref:Uncharacterized protein n=1 Tax=Portunus trituberculatus TaxID=210409 RepID=A0A5B7DY17_PORTR|nr:hypothetical protein [Portunus trituberculatus]